MFDLSFIQDTLQTADSVLQHQVDSVAVSVGSTVGTTVGAIVTAKLALGLGTVTRWLVEWSKMLVAKIGSLSPWQKAFFTLLWGQGMAFGNLFLLGHNLPALPADPATGATFLGGLAVALVAMGVNAAKDAVFGKKPEAK